MSASRSTLTVVNVGKGRGWWGNRMKRDVHAHVQWKRMLGEQDKGGCAVHVLNPNRAKDNV